MSPALALLTLPLVEAFWKRRPPQPLPATDEPVGQSAMLLVVLSIVACCCVPALLARLRGAGGAARLIDGKAIAAAIRREVKQHSEALIASHKVTPGLAVVLVGARTDSATYVKMKKKAAAEVGFHSIDKTFEESVTEEALLQCVQELNSDPSVHGILVQLPLPKHIDEAKVLESIRVEKDADGFSSENVGNMCLRGGKVTLAHRVASRLPESCYPPPGRSLVAGSVRPPPSDLLARLARLTAAPASRLQPPLAVPCTPAGCIVLLQRSGVAVRGKECVVVGRSNIVGMPVAHMLQSMDGTVTARSPEINRGHPRSPEVTRGHARSPQVTRDHSRSPLSPDVTLDHPRST